MVLVEQEPMGVVVQVVAATAVLAAAAVAAETAVEQLVSL
jgi:hypothetical protein